MTYDFISKNHQLLAGLLCFVFATEAPAWLIQCSSLRRRASLINSSLTRHHSLYPVDSCTKQQKSQKDSEKRPFWGRFNKVNMVNCPENSLNNAKYPKNMARLLALRNCRIWTCVFGWETGEKLLLNCKPWLTIHTKKSIAINELTSQVHLKDT